MCVKGVTHILIALSQWPRRRRPNTIGFRTTTKPFVYDVQWKMIEDLFEDPEPSPEGDRSRIDARHCLEGILGVLSTGARRQDLPDRYPSFTTCWRRHKQWTEAGTLVTAWSRLTKELDRRKLLDRSQVMGDGTFSPAKKRGGRWIKRKREKEPSSCC